MEENNYGKYNKIRKELLSWFLMIVIAIAAGLIVNGFVKPTTISGTSMSPTLEDGEMILLNSFKKDFKRGDIVVFNTENNRIFIKRVIGLPGDRVVIKDGQVGINGEWLVEPYIYEKETFGNVELVVQTGEYFVMGDNRTNSNDSRDFGPIKKQDIIGSLFTRIKPFKAVATGPDQETATQN